MPNPKWFAVFAIAATVTCNLSAENRCPGNVASLPYRLVKGHLMVVEVSINHSGPFNFLLDTGTHSIMVDPALAAALHLNPEGRMLIASVGSETTASLVQVPLIEAGSHALANQDAIVYDLANIGNLGIAIRGILGEDFLAHFDVLIDNSQRLLCLDNGTAMRSKIKGAHVPLILLAGRADTSINSLIIEAQFSAVVRPVRMKLDSGANESVLFDPPHSTAARVVSGNGTDGTANTFVTLPRQTLRIGQAEVSNVPLVAFAHPRKGLFTSESDGLLSLGLFRRIFIDHADRYLVVEPW
ncbi:MAG TPA: retropepsin-like aspartic protease [Terracidiphilus sp.]|jgi:hypothetical protein